MRRSLVLVLGAVCSLVLGTIVMAQDTPLPASWSDAGAPPLAGPPSASSATPDLGTPRPRRMSAPRPRPASRGPRSPWSTSRSCRPKQQSRPTPTSPSPCPLRAGPHNFSIGDRPNTGLPNPTIDVDVGAAQSTTFTVNLPLGGYYVFCDSPGHEPSGVLGTLRVQQPSAAARSDHDGERGRVVLHFRRPPPQVVTIAARRELSRMRLAALLVRMPRPPGH